LSYECVISEIHRVNKLIEQQLMYIIPSTSKTEYTPLWSVLRCLKSF